MRIRFEGTPVCSEQLTGIGIHEKELCKAMISLYPEDKYDFRVFDDPCELRRTIGSKNDVSGRSRMVAGYSWEWISKKDHHKDDITIHGADFSMKWNLSTDNTWAISKGSIDQIGCIHTCQGLEFDYVGVIIGNDMTFDGKEIMTDYRKRAKKE